MLNEANDGGGARLKDFPSVCRRAFVVNTLRVKTSGQAIG
jgi:hypothetical protein